MPARKKRPVLYEIVRHTRRSSDVGWREKRAREAQKSAVEPLRASPAAAARPPLASSEADPPRSLAGPTGPLTSVADSVDSAPAGSGPAVRFVDGRLLLDLAWPGITVTGVMAVVLLALAFQTGKRYAEPPAPEPAAEAAAAAPAKTTDPLALLPREVRPAPTVPAHRAPENTPVAVPAAPARSAAPAPQVTPAAPLPEAEDRPAFTFKPGYHYVVAQYFTREHKETAYDACRFLQENGVNALVIEKKADIELVATEAFQLKDGPGKAAARKACDALKDRIRTLGRAFAKQQAAAKKPQYAFDQPTERLRTK